MDEFEKWLDGKSKGEKNSYSADAFALALLEYRSMTCKRKYNKNAHHEYYSCTVCDFEMGGTTLVNYCPHCGRRVT